MRANTVEEALNLIGIFAFSPSGALMAVRTDMDVVGVVVPATLTALGGRSGHDVLIGDTPPAALHNAWWLPLIASMVTFLIHLGRHLGRGTGRGGHLRTAAVGAVEMSGAPTPRLTSSHVGNG
ncbi:MAG: trimeric intracellular cation channel family protein [Nakamurella sp.]